jgi:hypothetical protein
MRLCVVAAALFTTTWSSASAIERTVTLGLHGDIASSSFSDLGAAGSTSQLGNVYGVGWGGGLHADFNLVRVQIRFSMDFIHYDIDQSKFRESVRTQFGTASNAVTVDGGGLALLALNVGGKLPIVVIPRVSPYVTAGGGLALLNRDQLMASIGPFAPGNSGYLYPSESQRAKPSLNLGLGVDIDLGLKLYVEAKYAWIFNNGGTSSYAPISIGVTF